MENGVKLYYDHSTIFHQKFKFFIILKIQKLKKLNFARLKKIRYIFNLIYNRPLV